jgi:hypothetical protein
MPLLARHVAVNSGLTYPAIGDIDNSYITHLKTPSGSMHYDDLFDKALANVGSMWSLIGKSVFDRHLWRPPTRTRAIRWQG